MPSKLNNYSDKELVDLFVQQANQDAFGEIFSRHIKPTYRFIYTRVGRPDWTEDITSETFVTLTKVLSGFKHQSSLQSFIVGIAINKIRQFWQQLQKDNHISLNEDIVILDEENEDEPASEDNEELKKIMDQLPEKFKQVLTHRFIYNQSIKETAASLAMSSENVRVIQHRALKQANEIAHKLFEAK